MPAETPPTASDAYREIAGLVFLVLGVTGLVVAAFLLSPVAGLAALSVFSTAAGAWLTLGEA